MEIKVEVKTYIISYTCDKCNIGKMEFTGLSFTVQPPKHQHQCNQCGHTAIYVKHYPYLATEEINNVNPIPQT